MSAREVGWIELAPVWCGDAAAVRVTYDAPAASAKLVVVDPGEALARLHPDERAAGAALPIVRRRDWAAGRLALRSALERAGCDDHTPLGTDDRGAPRLPGGWRGSISHKRGLAVAIARREYKEAHTLGVDIELDGPSRIAIDSRVLTAAERDAVAKLDEPQRGAAVMRRFAMKEAIYKAIDPFVRRYVGFQEVELAIEHEVADAGHATVTSALGLVIEAAWQRWHGCVIAVARAHAA